MSEELTEGIPDYRDLFLRAMKLCALHHVVNDKALEYWGRVCPVCADHSDAENVWQVYDDLLRLSRGGA